MLHVGRLVGQRLRHDDLRFCIDRNLCVVALHKTVAALLDPTLGVGELPLHFGRRLPLPSSLGT